MFLTTIDIAPHKCYNIECINGTLHMQEYMLIALLMLSGGIEGPEIGIDVFPSKQACHEQAMDAKEIIDRINIQWQIHIDNEHSIGNEILPLVTVGMFCIPLDEAIGEMM